MKGREKRDSGPSGDTQCRTSGQAPGGSHSAICLYPQLLHSHSACSRTLSALSPELPFLIPPNPSKTVFKTHIVSLLLNIHWYFPFSCKENR